MKQNNRILRVKFFGNVFFFVVLVALSCQLRPASVHAAGLDDSACYKFGSLDSGSTVPVTLVTSDGRQSVASLPNQNPPSILQAMHFVNAHTCGISYYGNYPDYNGLEFSYSAGFNMVAEKFVTSGGNINFNGSPVAFKSDPADPNQPYWLQSLKKLDYNGISDMAYSLPTEDAVIANIANTGNFQVQATDNHSSGYYATMSVPATNCVTLSGTGSKKIVFERSVDWYSTVSDFLVQAIAFRDQMLATSPYSDSPGSYSFYMDLKKQNSNPYDLTSGGAVSSCGAGGSEYRFITKAPLLYSVTNNANPSVIYTGSYVSVSGSGFSAKGNSVELLDSNGTVVSKDTNVPLDTASTLLTNLQDQATGTYPPAGSYFLKVAANNSIWSNAISVTLKKVVPTNFQVSAARRGQVNLSWDIDAEAASESIKTYQIEKQDSGGAFSLWVSSTFNRVSIPKLPPSTAYVVRMRALYNDGTYSDYLTAPSVTTLPKPLPPVIMAVAGPNKSVTVSWSNVDDDDITGYSLTDASAGTTVPVDTSQTYTFSNLVSGTQHCFNVIAIINDSNRSDPSATACATADATIQNVGNVNLTGAVSSVTGIDSANFVSTDSSISSVDFIFDGVNVGTDTSAPWNSSFDTSNFPNGSGQIYAVIHRPGQTSVATMPVSITVNNPVVATTGTAGGTSGGTVPVTTAVYPSTISAVPIYSCPSGYAIQADHTCYRASYVTTKAAYWTNPVNNVNGYSCNYSPDFDIGPNATLVSASKFGLNPTYYPNGVCSVPAQTITNAASTVAATVTYAPCPAGYTISGSACNINTTPVSLAATAAQRGQVNLAWGNNGVPNATGIVIQRAATSSGLFSTIAALPFNASTTSYVDAGLPPSAAYQYRVALNLYHGDTGLTAPGPYTPVVSATTLAKPSTPVLAITATTTSSISLGLTEADAGIAAYDFFASSSPQNVLLASTTAKAYVASGLSLATRYCYFAVAFVNPLNVSASSTPACATLYLPPAVITGIAVNGVATASLSAGR